MSDKTPLVEEKSVQQLDNPTADKDEPADDEVVMSKKRYRLGVILLIIFIIIAIALAIVLIVDAASSPGGDPPLEPPVPTEEVEDFPIRTPEAWDIGVNHTVPWSMTVTSGTWMNLDISPDGETIIFDLVGDIYTLPIEGGEAELLRGGVSYDSQPRFSPSGYQILFTSDYSGCDNLWVMDSDGSDAKPVTNEPFRFVSNGMWNPVGSEPDDIVAVKWFTSTRTVPAGEIWLFNLTNDDDIEAGIGTRLVGRPQRTTQVGPEEPFFSTDGKYVYYSQSTESQTYTYGKNPHSGIYQIRRAEIATGAVTTITGGNGGAARPILSPNGEKLAFVRRRLFETALVTRDLETGLEQVVYKPLTFDQQVSSAPAGVYPRFAWEDDVHVIIYAQGDILRINTEDGSSEEIEYTAEVNLMIAETVVADIQSPGPLEEFEVKVAQNAAVSSDGNTILFNALGHTYVHDVDTGENTRLFPDRTDFEFGPTINSDVDLAAHVIWNDENLATIELIDLEDGDARILISDKGRYADPSFSPDGQWLVYTRLGSDSLSGPFFGGDTGIYVINIEDEDGKGDRVTTGTSALFDPDGEALWVNRGNSVVAVSLDMDGDTVSAESETPVVRSSYTQDMKLSPNQEWVAYIEFRQVYIQRLSATAKDDDDTFVVTARPDKAGDGDVGDGIYRLSEDGGRFLSWSADSNFLRWLHGTELFEVSIEAVLDTDQGTFQEDGKFVEAMRDTWKTIDLSFSHTPEDISEQCVIFTNAMILTMEDRDNETPEEGNLVMVGDRIYAVGPDAEAPDDLDCTVIDVDNGLLMPGFIDAHAHWGGTTRYFTQQSWEYVLNVAFGVTSVHNPSKDTVSVFADAELVKAGMKIGPRIFSTGSTVYGAEGSGHCELNSLDDARQFLRNLQKYGAYSAKSYQQPCRSGRQMLLQAARELRMAITPEGGMAPQWDVTMLIDGHTTIEHNIPIAPLHEDWVQLFAESGTGYTPTLVVNFGGMAGEDYWYEATNVWNNTRLMTFHPTSTIEAASIRVQKAGGDEDYHHIRVSESTNDINLAGGNVMAGAHGQRQGLAYHWELWMFAQGGMTPYRVLRAGTANAADALSIGEVGKVVEGYMADLIVYSADRSPLDDIRNTEHIQLVVTHGKVYDAATMAEVFPVPGDLPPGPRLNIPDLCS